MKSTGITLPLSDIVNVGVYRFDEYDTIGVDHCEHKGFIVGHQRGEKPFGTRRWIEPTETDITSDRSILDSLLILASKALPIRGEKSDRLVRSWCVKYGLPACTVEASQQVGYLAFPLFQFYDFLFFLRDAFWKAESIHDGFSSNVFDENPYKRNSWYFTRERKETLISEFINKADIRLHFEYKNGSPMFYNYAPDIISLVRYQFALTLLSDIERAPRRCKCCGSMFFAHRSNQLYGPCCTRQKRYAAERRRKEKEAQHG